MISTNKIKNHLNKFLSNDLFVFIFLLILILFVYQKTFNSYFESDEWFYLTYYLPLTNKTFGIFTAVFSMFTKAGYISGGQHVVPLAALIYYLNVKLFGLNFAPYAVMSLFLHSINSYLVYRLIKLLFNDIKNNFFSKNIYAFLSSFFFAISAVPIHSITGFAFFYGQNVLSVTFFLLCLISYELAYLKKSKKFILFTSTFLLSAIFTQESSSFLFLVLPIITVFRKKIFSYKYLIGVFSLCLGLYLLVRFIIPNVGYIQDKLVDLYLPQDTSKSIHTSSNQNLLSEITFRSITFPFRMVGSIFIPRETNAYIVKYIGPIISPYPSGGDPTTQLAFINYSGQATIIYLVGILISIFCISAISKFLDKRKYMEANLIVEGFLITFLGALPLVALIFIFPQWGYDIYFDSRYYYNPQVGAAILFPFLLLGISRFISQKLHLKKVSIIASLIFLLWFLNNIVVFGNSINQYTRNYTIERRAVISQITNILPKLNKITVFFVEVDGKSPFVSLPFFTSVPQALSVVYFYRNPLPDSFYTKPLFSGNAQGYQYENGRGFGYYTSKKELIAEVRNHKFQIDDVYGFYYFGKNSKIKNITQSIRKELKERITGFYPNKY